MISGRIEIRLLGRFEIQIGDDRFGIERFERRSAVDLVQYLALSPERRRHREQIYEALWPEADPDRARRRLYKATTLARKALGFPDSVRMQGDVVSLFPDLDCRLDCDVVENADLSDAQAVDAAIDAYRGELLADDPYAEWSGQRRRVLAERYRQLVRSTERWDTAIELDPTDEEAHVALMRDDLAAGARATVLRRYDLLVDALAQIGAVPGPEAERLREAAGSQPLRLPVERLVVADDRLIGRHLALKSVVRALQASRFTTVTGPGGVGKTHLARHVAAELFDDFDQQVWMCELGALSDAVGLPDEFLDSVGGSRHTDTDSFDSAVRIIGDRRVLVVFDNCEHLVESVRAFVDRLLDRCPQIRILATSREAIGAKAEVVVPLAPLSRAASIELFVTEVERRGGTVDIEDQTLDQICGRLDDAPLAIVLAAARARTLGLKGVERLLETRLDALRVEETMANANHTSLRTAIDWSFDLLQPDERLLLTDLGAFAKNFTLEGVLAVAGCRGSDETEIVDGFDRLVRRSLVMGPTPGPFGATFRLLESVRLFAREKTVDRRAADAHVDYVLTRVADARMGLRSDADAANDRFSFDFDDMRLARRRAAELNDHRLVALLSEMAPMALSLLRFEYLDWCEAAIGADPPQIESEDHARVAAAMAVFQASRGEVDRCVALARRALAVAPDDDVVLFAVGWLLGATGQEDRGRACFERLAADPTGRAGQLRSGAMLALVVIYSVHVDLKPLVAMSEALVGGGRVYRVNHLAIRSMYRLTQGSVADAVADLDEAIALADRHEHRFNSTAIRDLRAFTHVHFGSMADAYWAVKDSLEWPQRRGVWTLALNGLTMTSRLLTNDDNPEIATMLLAASQDAGLRHRTEAVRKPLIDELRVHDEFETWWRAGEAIDVRSAISLAVGVLETKLQLVG